MEPTALCGLCVPEMDECDDAWLDAVRRGDFAAAWSISAGIAAARDPAGSDDPGLPYHRRWVWKGQPVDGRDVLVRCYHGLGDVIQFARFLPALHRRARSVTVEMTPRLIPLFDRVPGIDRLLAFDQAAPSPPSECDIEIMEIPAALGLVPAQVPPPYLHVPPALVPEGTVGLCWRGGDWDEARSVPEALFDPLAGHPAISLVGEATGLPVLNPQGCPMDMVTTAALVAGCDLVVTVDTMIAHLAGAMGRPVWLLVKHDPDWRWTCGGDRSPWYPSMRLYRQQVPGDWPGVVAAVGADLAASRANGSVTGLRTGS